MQYHACCSDSEQRTVLDDSLFSVAEYDVIDECASIAGTVFKYIFQLAILSSAYSYGAMVYVNAWVVGLNGTIYTAVLHVTSYYVGTHLQRNNLLVMEYVLYDSDVSVATVLRILVGIVFLLCIA